jgi:hypothetical protein
VQSACGYRSPVLQRRVTAYMALTGGASAPQVGRAWAMTMTRSPPSRRCIIWTHADEVNQTLLDFIGAL